MSAIHAVIVNFESTSLVARCLESLALQTTPVSRILIVDNSESTPLFEHQLPSLPGLSVLSGGGNIGFAAACNKAVSLLPAEDWVLFLNPDTELAADCVAALARAAQQYPDAVLGAVLLAAKDTRLLDGVGDRLHVFGVPYRGEHGRSVDRLPLANVECFGVCGAAMLVRIDRFRTLAGFDARFFCYLEDVDFCMRQQLNGGRCIVVADAHVYHQGSATVGVGSPFYVYHGQRNLIWLFVKNMPLPLLILFFPAHIVVNLAAIFIYIWRGSGTVVWKAKRDAVLALPDILRSRNYRINLSACVRLLRVLDWRLRR